MNILQLNDILKTVCMKVPTVNSYYGDDVYEVWNTTEVKYASMAFNLQSTRQTDRTRTFEGVIYFADRLTEDCSNRLSIYADADNAIANVLTKLQDATDEGEFSISEYQIVHFQQKFADYLAGGYANISITVSNACDIVLLSERVGDIIIITENGEYDVTTYETAIVNVQGGIETEVDPIFTASPAYTITENDIQNWNNTISYFGSYVTKSELSAAAYITAGDLPDYSNTYQAKGNYITPVDLENAAYITVNDLPDYSNTYQAKGDYITPADLDAAAYITANDLPDYSNTYQAKGNYITQETDPFFSASVAATITAADIDNWNRGGSIDLSSYVTKAQLSAAAYITAGDLPDYSNTYQAKGNYITPADLENAAYITAGDLPDYSNTYQAKGNYITPADLENAAYITAGDLPDYSNTYQAKGNYITQETDPVFTASPAHGITSDNITKWNNTATYLNSYVTKAQLSAAAYITANDLPDYSNTYQAKGDYVTKAQLSAQAYITANDLPDYSNTYQAKGNYITQETDPVFTASPAHGITSDNITKWNNTATYLNSYVTKAQLSAQSYIKSAQFVFDASTATLHITI